MQRRIVINKGKKYLVNCVGGDEGIGAGCPVGVAWLQDELGAWYSVQLTGTPGSLAFAITAIPLADYGVGFFANDFGFQLIQANDGNVYQVSIDSAGPTVVITQSPSQYNSFKPFLYLLSNTDGQYYVVPAVNNTGTISLVIPT